MNNEDNRHRFVQNKKYYTISIYAVVVVIICAIIIKLIFSWTATNELAGKYIAALYPIIFGFLIGYMLNPLVNLFDRRVFSKLAKRSGKLSRALSIAISYVLFLGLIIVVFVFLAPQLYATGVDLFNRLQEWYSAPESASWVVSLQEKFPQMDITGWMKAFKETVMGYINADNIGNMASSIAPRIFSTAGALFTILYNIVFSVIVSVYVIIDKKRIILNIKRLVRAVFRPATAAKVNHSLKEVHSIFSGFIIGKTIDSLIIGTLCFIFMKIFSLPYAALISLIVGITNMIPYIGPFVGAIPGFVIILMLDPLASLVYLVLVMLLQWFDGFYLGPKILGVSTGLRPVWIIFALCVGGAAAGVMGMFLGVPFVASVALLLDHWVENRIQKLRAEDKAAKAALAAKADEAAADELPSEKK